MKKQLISAILACALAASAMPSMVLPLSADGESDDDRVILYENDLSADKWSAGATVSEKGTEGNKYLRVYNTAHHLDMVTYKLGSSDKYDVKAGDSFEISFRIRTDSVNSARMFQISFAKKKLHSTTNFVIDPTKCDENGWYTFTTTYTHSGAAIKNPAFQVRGGDGAWYIDKKGSYTAAGGSLNSVAPFDIDDVSIIRVGDDSRTNLIEGEPSFGDRDYTLRWWSIGNGWVDDYNVAKIDVLTDSRHLSVGEDLSAGGITYTPDETKPVLLEPGTYRLCGYFRVSEYDANPIKNVLSPSGAEAQSTQYIGGYTSAGGWSKKDSSYLTDSTYSYYYKTPVNNSRLVAVDNTTGEEYGCYHNIYKILTKGVWDDMVVDINGNHRSVGAKISFAGEEEPLSAVLVGKESESSADYLEFGTEWTYGEFEFTVDGDSLSDSVQLDGITLDGGLLYGCTFPYAIDGLTLTQLSSTVREATTSGVNLGALMVLLAKKQHAGGGNTDVGQGDDVTQKSESYQSIGVDGTWSTDGGNTVNAAAGEKNSFVRIYNIGHHYGAARYTFEPSVQFKANTTYTVSLRLRHSCEDSLRAFRINFNGKQVKSAFYAGPEQYWNEPLVFTTTLGELSKEINFQITGDTWGFWGGKSGNTLGYSSMAPFDIDDLWIVEGSYASVEGLDPAKNLVQSNDGWTSAGDTTISQNGYGARLVFANETPHISVSAADKTASSVTFTLDKSISLDEGKYLLGAKFRTSVYNANPESHLDGHGTVHYAGYNASRKVPDGVSVCEICKNASGDFSKLGGNAYAVIGDYTYYYKKGGHVIAVDSKTGDEVLYYNNLYLTSSIKKSNGAEDWSSGGLQLLESDSNERCVKVSAVFANGNTVELPISAGRASEHGDGYLYFDTEWTDGAFELTVPEGGASLVGFVFTGSDDACSMLAYDIDSLKLNNITNGANVSVFPTAEWTRADWPVVVDLSVPTVIEGDNYLYMAEDLSLWQTVGQTLELKESDGGAYLAASDITSNTRGFTLNTGIRLAAGTYEFEGLFRTSVEGENSKLRLVVNSFVMDLGAKNELYIDNSWTKAKFTLTLYTTTELVFKVCGGKSASDTQAFDMDELTLVKIK